MKIENTCTYITILSWSKVSSSVLYFLILSSETFAKLSDFVFSSNSVFKLATSLRIFLSSIRVPETITKTEKRENVTFCMRQKKCDIISLKHDLIVRV